MDLHEYANLTPDLVIDAIENFGYLSDLRVFPLNSYENRVYQVGIEDAEPIIAKFYRPNRWSNEQIQEEHDFSLALTEMEIPIISPMQRDGQTLFEYQGYRFALYPRRGGHAPDFDDLDFLYTLGQHLGRIHALGKAKPFEFRPSLNIQTFSIESREFILTNDFLPNSLKASYESISGFLIEKLEQIFKNHSYNAIRLHGDCHPGNILSRPDSMYLVDLDDARNGPAIQDMWMMLSGDEQQKRSQLSSVLDGYEEFCEFDTKELHLIEALRTLRLMHYAGWLAKRWDDPAFPMAFPWFNTEKYWAEHILELKEQFSILDEPVINLQGF